MLFVVAKNILVVILFQTNTAFLFKWQLLFLSQFGLSKCAQIIFVIGNKWFECMLWLTDKCSVNMSQCVVMV